MKNFKSQSLVLQRKLNTQTSTLLTAREDVFQIQMSDCILLILLIFWKNILFRANFFSKRSVIGWTKLGTAIIDNIHSRKSKKAEINP